MKKCTGLNTMEWGFDSIFDVKCTYCGNMVEFFQDEIKRRCNKCKQLVTNNRKSYGCYQWCSSDTEHTRNLCSRYKKTKDRFYGRL